MKETAQDATAGLQNIEEKAHEFIREMNPTLRNTAHENQQPLGSISTFKLLRAYN